MKETNINDLTTRLTDEESNIVDSIINDLNKDSVPPKNPGQMPPGQMPPGQMPPGQMPPGQMPPGQMPPGQMPPGQMPPGQMPPGQMPPGQMPPGQMPPGQNEPHKVNVTPQQKKMLEMMNYEDQQIFLNKIRLNQEKEKVEEEEQKKQILSEEKIKEIKGNAIEELKNSIKEPVIISSIAFIFSIPQINNLFLSTKSHMLVNDTGDITIVSLLIKALLVGITYYFIKKYNIV